MKTKTKKTDRKPDDQEGIKTMKAKKTKKKAVKPKPEFAVSLGQFCELERLLSQVTKIASEVGLNNIFKLVHVRNMIMAKELKHQLGGLLDAQDSAGRTVKYLIREETTPIWQMIGLNAGDEKRLELFLKKLSKAKGGIFFGVFRNLELIRVERAPAELVVSEIRDQFNRPRKFKKRTPRSRVNLSIGKNFLANHDKDVELVFPK